VVTWLQSSGIDIDNHTLGLWLALFTLAFCAVSFLFVFLRGRLAYPVGIWTVLCLIAHFGTVFVLDGGVLWVNTGAITVAGSSVVLAWQMRRRSKS
jgi:hypothetical protein